MISVEKYDHSNITLSNSSEIAILYNDSFRRDFLHSEFWPPGYDLSDLPASLVGQQLMKFPKFKLAVDQFAWRMYLNLRNNSNHALLLYRDSDQKGEAIGLALYRLPTYYEIPPPSLLSRCKTWVMSMIFRLRNLWKFGSFENPLQPAAMLSELSLGDKMCHASMSEERLEYLRSLSRKELYGVSYPKTMSIGIGLFGVRSDQQGKGLGRKLMEMTIKHIKDCVPLTEPPFNGPQKLQLSAAPIAIDFYQRCGFTIAAQYPSKQKSGRTLMHTFLYMNLT